MGKIFNFFSIKKKLILAFIPVSLIVLILLSIFVNNTIKGHIIDSFKYASDTALVQVDRAFTTYFQTVKDNCMFLSRDSVIRNVGNNLTRYLKRKFPSQKSVLMKPSKSKGVEKQIYEKYKLFGKHHPGYAYIYLGTRYGGYVQWPQTKTKIPYDPRVRPYYEKALQNPDKVNFTSAYYSGIDDVVILSTVKSVRDSKGKIIGVQGVDVSLKGLTDLIKRIKIGKTGYIVLIDKQGIILAHPKFPKLLFKSMKHLDIEEVFLKNKQRKLIKKRYKGEDYYINYFTSNMTGWRLVVYFKQSELAGKINYIKKIFMVLIIIFIIIFVPIIIFSAHTLTKPLKKIMKTMRKMKSGDFSVRIKNISRDEIGELASTFNKMADDINCYKIKLKKERDNLDLKVKQRTSELEEKNENMTQSIKYAKTIQNSILPDKVQGEKIFKEHFIIYKPRDIVGGDFYFFQKLGETYLICIIDCTGHGVPGALMTMLSSAVLMEKMAYAVYENPAKYLKEINRTVKEILNKPGGHIKNSDLISDDGLDIGICFYNASKNVLTYAGAKIDLYYSYENQINLIKGDKQSIGYVISLEDFEFENHKIDLKPGMVFYLLTDGLVSQNGGENDFPYGKNRFSDLLSRISSLPLSDQKNEILADYERYRGSEAQRDDIAIISFVV